MKRQSLILLLAFSAGLLFMAVPMVLALPRAAPSGIRTEQVGAVILQVPADLGPARERRTGGWSIRDFPQARAGSWLFSTEPTDGTPFPDLCRRWFRLPAAGPGPLRYEAEGSSWLFQEIHVYGAGACALRKRGRLLRFIAVFEEGGRRHWIQLETTHAFTPVQELFHRVLLSARNGEGAAPDPRLAAEMRGIAQASRFRLVQPAWLFPLLPAPVLLVAFAIIRLVQRRSGRLPDALQEARAASRFLQSGVEVGIFVALQRQFLDATVQVAGEELLLYTFGTLFLRVPRGACRDRIRTGQAFLGPPWLELDLQGPLDFRKRLWKFGRYPGRIRLRIYTQELSGLHAALL